MSGFWIIASPFAQPDKFKSMQSSLFDFVKQRPKMFNKMKIDDSSMGGGFQKRKSSQFRLSAAWILS